MQEQVRDNMQQQRRQTKRTCECGTGGVLEAVKALLPKTSRAPAAAKKPAPPVEPEQPQLAREPAAPQTPLEKELHRLYCDFKFYVGRDKLYWLMRQQQMAEAAGREFPYFSHRLIQSWLRKQELSPSTSSPRRAGLRL